MSPARPLRAIFGGLAGFAAGYLLAGGLKLPVVAYDPLARRVFWSAQVTGTQMRYYGDLLTALLAALACALFAWLWPRRARLDATLAAGAALALVALDVAYFLSRLLASS